MNYLNTAILTIVLGCLFMASCTKTEQGKLSEAPGEPSEKTFEKIYLTLDVGQVSSLESGDEYILRTEDEQREFVLQVQRVQETMPGIITIAANVEDRDTGLASLVIKNNRITGSLDLYKENIRYKVRFDSTSNSHYIQEMTPEEREQREGGTPLLPSQNEN